MANNDSPTMRNGKICYLQIPAIEVQVSITFYKTVFNWNIRTRSDGHLAFDDAVGAVSGSWVTGRPPSVEPGLLIYIYVESVEDTLVLILANGGKLVQPIGMDPGEITARFSDPAGNVLGLYQHPA